MYLQQNYSPKRKIINKFPDTQRLREFVAIIPPLQEMVKVILQDKMKEH